MAQNERDGDLLIHCNENIMEKFGNCVIARVKVFCKNNILIKLQLVEN